MKRNWIRNMIGGLSFTTILFVFQACYGTPRDIGNDILVQGMVKSKTTGQPIQGIKVAPVHGTQFQLTDYQGKFSFYIFSDGDLMLRFEDADSTQNGTFRTKDTTLYNVRDTVFVDIALEDK